MQALAGNIGHAPGYPLVPSDRVEGTVVYNDDREDIGRIERVMIDKRTGKVAYAVMSFGGFLGLGSEFYPVPWSKLVYNPDLEGYQVSVTPQELKNSPLKLDSSDEEMPRIEEERALFNYYGAPFYGS